MAVATLRHHNSTFINNHSSSINSSSASHIGSRSSSGEILHAQLQQGGHNSLSTPSNAQAAAAGNLWDLANSSDMSYELAAAGTGKDKTCYN